MHGFGQVTTTTTTSCTCPPGYSFIAADPAGAYPAQCHDPMNPAEMAPPLPTCTSAVPAAGSTVYGLSWPVVLVGVGVLAIVAVALATRD